MQIEFSLPSCITTGVCTSCGSCSFSTVPDKKNPSEYNEADAGEAKAIIWTDTDTLVWTGGRVQSPVVVTYSISDSTHPTNFSSTPWGLYYSQLYGYEDNWQDFTTYQKSAIRAAATTFSEASGIFLVEVDQSENADVEWHYGDADASLGIVGAVGPDGFSDSIGSHLFVNKFYSQYWETVDFRPGQKGFAHLLHEFGHAVNLKHPFFGKYQLNPVIENRATTVMSHQENPDGTFATDLKALDKQALQYLYGTVINRSDQGVEWRQWQQNGLISIADDKGRLIRGIDEGRDLAVGGHGDDIIKTFGGDDWVRLSKGRDYIDGGAGVDTLVLKNGSLGTPSLYLLASTNGSTGRSGFTIDDSGNVTHFDGFEFLQYEKITYSLAGFNAQVNSESIVMNLYAMIFNQDGRQYASAQYHIARLMAGEVSTKIMVQEFITSRWFDQPTGWDAMSFSERLVSLTSRINGDRPSSALISDLSTANCDFLSKLELISQYFGQTEKHFQPMQLHDLSMAERVIPKQDTTNGSDAKYNLTTIYQFLFGTNASEAEIKNDIYALNWMSGSYEDIVASLVSSTRFKSALDDFDPQKLALLSGAGITIEDLRSSQFTKSQLLVQTLEIEDISHRVFNIQERDGTGGFFFFDRGTFKEVHSALRIDQVKNIETRADGRLIVTDWRNDVIDLGLGVSKVEFKDGTLFAGQANKDAIIDFLNDNLLPSMSKDVGNRLAAVVGTHDVSAREILKAVSNSGEFASEFALNFTGMQTDQFITAQYKSLLGRDASTTERAGMTKLINEGFSRLDVFKTIIFSTEFLRSLDSEIDKPAWHEDQVREMNFRAWEVIQNVSGDYYEIAQKQGVFSYWQVVDFMMLSPAYTQQAAAQYGNETWLNVIYRRTFGEEPNFEKVKPWLNMLEEGVTRRDVVYRLLESSKERIDFLSQGLVPNIDSQSSKTIADLQANWNINTFDYSDRSLDLSAVVALGERVVDFLDPWETRDGFSWKDGGTIRALHGGWELDRVDFYGDSIINVVMKDGAHIWLPKVDRLEFLNGTLDMRDGGAADLAQAAYRTVLGRAVDKMSLGPQVKALDAGTMSIETLVSYLVNSDEFTQRWGTLNNDQFVRLMYSNTEGGVPNEAAVQSWRVALDNGATREGVASAFATWELTLEANDARSPHGWWVERAQAAGLAAIYDVALDRLPDAQGFDYWMRELEAGLIGPINLAVLFGRSEEFVDRHASRTTAEFVHELYQSALDRAPDQGGFDFWMNDLTQGLQGRDNMVFAFGFSAEKLADFAVLPDGEPFFG